MDIQNHLQFFWSIPPATALKELQSEDSGLTSSEANKRLSDYGANRLKPKKRSDLFFLLFNQFRSPIILILLFATGLSFFLHNFVDATIILSIVLVSGLLGFWQEHSARSAVEKLLAIAQIKVLFAINCNQKKINIEFGGH